MASLACWTAGEDSFIARGVFIIDQKAHDDIGVAGIGSQRVIAVSLRGRLSTVVGGSTVAAGEVFVSALIIIDIWAICASMSADATFFVIVDEELIDVATRLLLHVTAKFIAA